MMPTPLVAIAACAVAVAVAMANWHVRPELRRIGERYTASPSRLLRPIPCAIRRSVVTIAMAFHAVVIAGAWVVAVGALLVALLSLADLVLSSIE